jgi:hypothetical protein
VCDLVVVLRLVFPELPPSSDVQEAWQMERKRDHMNMKKKLVLLSVLYGTYVGFVLGDFLRARSHATVGSLILISLGATVAMLLLIWKISLSGSNPV